MNPQRPGFGSTSPSVGGQFVASQMQNAQPGLPSMGPQAPGFAPGTNAQPLPGQLPQKSIMPQMAHQPAGVNALAKKPKSEVQLIVEALIKRLEALTDKEKGATNAPKL